MKKEVVSFKDIDKKDISTVGGKGANLGQLVQIGMSVPTGFCITTDAYQKFWQGLRADKLLAQLKNLEVDDTKKIKNISQEIRNLIKSKSMDQELKKKINSRLEAVDKQASYAVRSSATLEDLPTASFAGQHETYLNVSGVDNIINKIKSCWASLYVERAITYRLKNEIDQAQAAMAVVVQKMVVPEKSGIMFTADPVTNRRNVVTIDAGFGLGEAFVAGIVTPDSYQVDNNNQIITKEISRKEFAIRAKSEGGTYKEELSDQLKETQVLTTEEILELARLGRKIADDYQTPQDIEWCIAEDKIYITQTRPITSLFPVPKTGDEDRYHVYISFNHVQVMTDSIKPLGQSLLRLLFPFGKDKQSNPSSVLLPAGGRLYVDLTYLLTTWPVTKVWPTILENADELITDAVKQVVKREKFKSNPPAKGIRLKLTKFLAPILGKAAQKIFIADNEPALREVKQIADTKIETVREQINNCQNSKQKLEAIQETVSRILLDLMNEMIPYIVGGIASYKLLGKLLSKEQGSDQLARKLISGLEGNITTEMGLKIGDLADLLRGQEELIQLLKDKPAKEAFAQLKQQGSREVAEAIDEFFANYGMRGIGEIDITKKRYQDDPQPIAKSILNNLATYKQGEHKEKYQQLTAEAEQAAEKIIDIMSKAQFGWLKSTLAKRLVANIRSLMPLREHPKYTIISCFQLYKQALLEVAAELKEENLLNEPEDIYYLRLPEIMEVVEDNKNYKNLIQERKDNYKLYEQLTPPRVITSEGEIVKGNYKVDKEENKLIGTPVSSGVVEGQAKVVLDPDNANLNKGEILVVPFTDPGWTPLFINAAGLVMEVGGLMTHGAVVAREYGIPAVVGVEQATELIEDGELIKINGDLGTIERLDY